MYPLTSSLYHHQRTKPSRLEKAGRAFLLCSEQSDTALATSCRLLAQIVIRARPFIWLRGTTTRAAITATTAATVSKSGAAKPEDVDPSRPLNESRHFIIWILPRPEARKDCL